MSFNQSLALDSEGIRQAYFGLDVLKGLVDGIDDFLTDPHGRWKQFRSLGPALLGAVMYLDDAELIDRIGKFAGACVVITKKGRTFRDTRNLANLKALARQLRFPAEVFPELEGMTWKEAGRAPVLGPSSPMPTTRIPAVRTIGFRKRGRYVPLLHAKLFVLGHLWWHDEGPLGHVADVIGFTPKRIWLGSANATERSRQSLEFGMWTDDPKLLRAATKFIVALMAASEDVDPDADTLAPELVEVDFDEEARAEAAFAACTGEDDED